MKYLVLACVLFGTLQAQELTASQVTSTYTYNHKPSIKIKHRRLLEKMANISEKEAQNIAGLSSDEEVKNRRLMRHGKRLFYAIRTTKSLIKVDALDGSIMSKKVLR